LPNQGHHWTPAEERLCAKNTWEEFRQMAPDSPITRNAYRIKRTRLLGDAAQEGHKVEQGGNVFKVLGAIIAIVAAIVVAFAFVPFILMVCWNVVVPSVFGGPSVNFLQAFCGWFFISLIGATIGGNHSKS